MLIVQGDQQGRRKVDATLAGQAIEAAVEASLVAAWPTACKLPKCCVGTSRTFIRVLLRLCAEHLQASAARIVLASPLGGGGGGGGLFGGLFGGGSAASGNLKLSRTEQQVGCAH